MQNSEQPSLKLPKVRVDRKLFTEAQKKIEQNEKEQRETSFFKEAF